MVNKWENPKMYTVTSCKTQWLCISMVFKLLYGFLYRFKMCSGLQTIEKSSRIQEGMRYHQVKHDHPAMKMIYLAICLLAINIFFTFFPASCDSRVGKGVTYAMYKLFQGIFFKVFSSRIFYSVMHSSFLKIYPKN